MPEDAFHVVERSDPVGFDIVRLDLRMFDDVVHVITLVRAFGLLAGKTRKDHRERMKWPSMGFAQQPARHAGDGRGIQSAAQERSNWPNAAKTTADCPFEEFTEGFRV